MKIAIYSPYLDTFGGGERYILTLTEALSSDSSVDLLFDNHLYSLGANELKLALGKRFGLNLSNVNIRKAPMGRNSNSLERLLFFRDYDALFYLTDGSIFYPTAKKNILHIQSPLMGEATNNLWSKIKLRAWNLIIYNSKFTQANAKPYWLIKSQVIYPPVDVYRIKPQVKKNYILSVGRFFGFLKDKKQEVLIRTFKEIYKSQKLKGWSLHLAGNVGKGDEEYLKELKTQSAGFPIDFHPNISYEDLLKLYGQSAIYWHAAGFEEEDPTKMEHFGISTVEAMAAGCVPIVINKGGQTEIVEDGRTGFLWNSTEELARLTSNVILDNKLRSEISKNAISASKKFSKERFAQEIKDLL